MEDDATFAPTPIDESLIQSHVDRMTLNESIKINATSTWFQMKLHVIVTKILEPSVRLKWFMDYALELRQFLPMPVEAPPAVTVDKAKFQQHVDAHCTDKLKEHDKLVMSMLNHIDFEQFYWGLKSSFTQFLLNKSSLPYVLVTGKVQKSGYWCTLLILLFLQTSDIKYELPIDVIQEVKGRANLNYVFVDDIAYSGSQLVDFLRGSKFELVPGLSCQQTIVTCACSSAAIQRLRQFTPNLFYAYEIENIPGNTTTATIPQHKLPDMVSVDAHFFHSKGFINDCGEKYIPPINFLSISPESLHGFYSALALVAYDAPPDSPTMLCITAQLVDGFAHNTQVVENVYVAFGPVNQTWLKLNPSTTNVVDLLKHAYPILQNVNFVYTLKSSEPFVQQLGQVLPPMGAHVPVPQLSQSVNQPWDDIHYLGMDMDTEMTPADLGLLQGSELENVHLTQLKKFFNNDVMGEHYYKAHGEKAWDHLQQSGYSADSIAKFKPTISRDLIENIGSSNESVKDFVMDAGPPLTSAVDFDDVFPLMLEYFEQNGLSSSSAALQSNDSVCTSWSAPTPDAAALLTENMKEVGTGEKGAVLVGPPSEKMKELIKGLPQSVAVKIVRKVRNITAPDGFTREQLPMALDESYVLRRAQGIAGVVRMYGCIVVEIPSSVEPKYKVYLVMEDLTKFIEINKAKAAPEVKRQALKRFEVAVQSLFERDIYHGDIWEPNMLLRLTPTGSLDDIRLIDFGEACFLGEGGPRGRYCDDWRKKVGYVNAKLLPKRELRVALKNRDLQMLGLVDTSYSHGGRPRCQGRV